ncbi:hypothetical protein MLD38_040210 [Melastoma candidum]|uniref:Uncharacterized protein n=1 Tax=Melastoma candidum TaxID=119954 RepID=A0ACB9L4I9_9MYRT|nr:hypothetical protein MLD38_040210 [Melastoma candidum]
MVNEVSIVIFAGNEFEPWEREKKFRKKPFKFHPVDMDDSVDARLGGLDVRQLGACRVNGTRDCGRQTRRHPGHEALGGGEDWGEGAGKDDIKVPCGKLIPSEHKDSPLEYNEYPVYDPKQTSRRILVEVKYEEQGVIMGTDE